MIKALLPLAAGAVMGAAAAALVVDVSLERPDSSPDDAEPRVVTDDAPSAATAVDVEREAALASLTAAPSPALRRAAALDLLDRLGGGTESIGLIAANLPALEAIHFELDAIAKRSLTDAKRAVGAALALGDFAKRREALTRIAATLASRNPRAALAHATAIDDFELLPAYRSGVLLQWADYDREGLYDYLAAANPDELPDDESLFAALAAYDPERLLAESERLSPALHTTAATAALASLASSTPLAAYERAQALGGERREVRLRTIARIHAEQDPVSALAHLRSVPLHERGGLIDGVADADLLGVVDALLAEYSATEVNNLAALSRMRSLVATRLATGSIDVAAVLERRPAGGDGQVDAAFDYLLQQWGSYDAEAALRWTLEHPDRISDDVYASIARGLGSTNPELAKQTANQLSGERRDRWVVSAAAGMAQRNLAAALDWIEPYRDRPLYESTAASLIRAATDPFRGSLPGQPKAAAEFLDRGSAAMRAALLPQVAAAWAIDAPAAAATWAAEVEIDVAEADRRTAAVRNVAGLWSRRDAAAAIGWALDLPSGADRDAALAVALPVVAATGHFDPRTLEAFSSDAAREEAVPDIAYALAARDGDRARKLVDTYVTNAERRDEAKAAIERGRVYRGIGTNGVGIAF